MKDRSTFTSSPTTKRAKVGVSSMFARSLTLLAVAVATFVAGHVRADTDTFILDTFTDAEDTWLSAHTVDVNLPGGAWGANGNVAVWGEPDVVNNAAFLNVDMGTAIPLASAGSYTKPTNFTISVDMTLTTLNEDSAGTGLGFYSYVTPWKVHGMNDFCGLRLMRDGELQYVSDNGGETTVIKSVTWHGIGGAEYVTGAMHTLSYSVDTLTGRITSISLSGSMDSFGDIIGATTNVFTDNTGRAGFVMHGFATGTFDNFSVGPIPPMGTMIIIR